MVDNGCSYNKNFMVMAVGKHYFNKNLIMLLVHFYARADGTRRR